MASWEANHVARLLELPPGILDIILDWLPHCTKLKLRLTCKCLDAAISSGFTSLSLPGDAEQIACTVGERYHRLQQLMVPDGASRVHLAHLLLQTPDLLSNQLSVLHLELGSSLRSAAVVPMMISALGPKQQLSVHMPHSSAFHALGHLHDHQCLTRLAKLSLEAFGMGAGLPGMGAGLHGPGLFGMGGHLPQQLTAQVHPLLDRCFPQLLHLTELQYTCTAPPQIHIIAHLTSLQRLSVRCRFGRSTAEMGEALGAVCSILAGLTSLTLTGFRVERSLAQALSALTQLRDLEVVCQDQAWDYLNLGLPNMLGHGGSNSGDLDLLAQAVGRLTLLQSLTLSSSASGFDASRSTALAKLTQLTRLSVSRFATDAAGLLHPALAGLQSVELSGRAECWSNPATQIPTQLRELSSLVARCAATAVPMLAAWTALQRLCLSHSGVVQRAGLAALATLPALRTLKLDAVALDAAVPAAAAAAPDAAVPAVAAALDAAVAAAAALDAAVPAAVEPLPTFPVLRSFECRPTGLGDDALLELCHALRRATQLCLLFQPCVADAATISRAFCCFTCVEDVQLDFKACSEVPVDPLGMGQVGAALLGLCAAVPDPPLSRLKFATSFAVRVEDVWVLSAFPQLAEVVLGHGSCWPPSLLAAARGLAPGVRLTVEGDTMPELMY